MPGQWAISKFDIAHFAWLKILSCLDYSAFMWQVKKKVIAIFGSTGCNRPFHLDRLRKALVTIRPSSLEAERAFSTARKC